LKKKKSQKNKEKKVDNRLQNYIKEINLMNKKVNILNEVSKVTATDFEINKILEKFLDITMEAVQADAGSILLIDKLSDTLYFAVARGKKASKLKDYKLTLGEGIAGWVAQSGKPLITPDVKKDKRFAAKISKEIKYETRNIICAPLKFEEEVLGVIELINKKGDEVFNEEDLDMLLTFTPYIGVILKNAQLFIEDRKKIKRLEHLMEITKFVNSTLNLETLLDRMLEIFTNVLNAEAGSILLLDEEKDELFFAAATGEKKDSIKNIRVPIGEGVVGWVAREDKPVLIADAQNDPRFFKQADQKTKFKTKTIVAVPLKTKEKLIGVVEILNKKDGLFNEEDLNLLEALSNQAAVAIENAKLYENLKTLFLNTVKSLAAAIETKDIYTRGHSERVTQYSLIIARKLGMDSSEIEKLRLAALLHDIGKIGIDESILRKPAKLSPSEFEEIKKHPIYAANILETIPQLHEIIPVIKHHHERFDGNGYPDGLKGEKIPYSARIIAIADTFDAMSSDRPYRKALPVQVCLQEILNCSGTQFDPNIALVAEKALRDYFNSKNFQNK
jgi:putative nucleotidyltransferase with HDIG domain